MKFLCILTVLNSVCIVFILIHHVKFILKNKIYYFSITRRIHHNTFDLWKVTEGVYGGEYYVSKQIFSIKLNDYWIKN